MSAVPTTGVSRRIFLGTAAAGAAGLVIAFSLRGGGPAAGPAGGAATAAPAAAPPDPNPFDAWLRLAPDGAVTLIVAKSEMGQGVFGTLPMILAEELDLDWTRVRIEQAPTRPTMYPHMTGGSSAVRTSWLPLRQAGAAARAMLVRAAADRWSVDPASCRTEHGVVMHDPSGRRAAYADLAAAAARLPMPDLATVALKPREQFRLLGTSPVRADLPGKVDGRAIFGLDVRVPGMLFAVVARCPTFEGQVRRFDAARARQVAGVRAVFEIPAVPADRIFARGGVAVVAESTWAAIQGREALTVEWDHGAHAAESSAALSQQFDDLLAKDGEILVRNDGDVAGAIARAARRVEATYDLPFQPHAPMEPMNCTVHVRADRVECWAPVQGPHWVQEVLAKQTNIPAERVEVHTTLMGGSFGRRFAADWVVEAMQISQRLKAPIQVVWTREDDIRHDFYRGASRHRMVAALDADGRPTALHQKMASTSIESYWAPASERYPERSELHGTEPPYAIPAMRLEYSPARTAIPVQWWRSVAHSWTAFALESFVDEMAYAAGLDPVDYRLMLMEGARWWPLPWEKHEPVTFSVDRLRGVLTLAAERAGWHRPPPAGRARGVACAFSFHTHVAEVAEVSIEHGVPRVHRVVCAVDCGQVVHPDAVAAQIEGGVIYGLSATLYDAITVARGQPQQANFDTLRMPRMQDAPEVEVHIVPSTDPPTGVGEPGLPPLAPAVANALFALTGKRQRRLPIGPLDL